MDPHRALEYIADKTLASGPWLPGTARPSVWRAGMETGSALTSALRVWPSSTGESLRQTAGWTRWWMGYAGTGTGPVQGGEPERTSIARTPAHWAATGHPGLNGAGGASVGGRAAGWRGLEPSMRSELCEGPGLLMNSFILPPAIYYPWLSLAHTQPFPEFPYV